MPTAGRLMICRRRLLFRHLCCTDIQYQFMKRDGFCEPKARHGQNFLFFIPLFPLYTVTASPEALCPSGPAFSAAKVLPRKHTQVPLALFEHNFPAAFPIYNRPYLTDARYRNDKIPPKFLVCCFLLGNLWMRVKIRSLRKKPSGFRREGKIKTGVQPLNK